MKNGNAVSLVNIRIFKMVEVTKSNFNEMMPLVEKAIKNSSFIAIDAEFTGLTLGGSNNLKLFDTVQEQYEKLKYRASSFIPCQIGLSMYTKCPNENSYAVETYVFYVCPCMIGRIDKTFMCQASSLTFLSAYDFDFKKFINDGIPYMNENEHKQVCQEFKDGTIGLSYQRMMALQSKRERDIQINNTILKARHNTVTKPSNESSTDDKKLVLPIDRICPVYFQLTELRNKYPTLWAYVEDDKIIVKEVSLEERRKLEENIPHEEEKFLDYFWGFTKVFRLLRDNQKPIVGHNLLMDLMLFYQHFYQDLPSSYKIFKSKLHILFPVIYDTRHIWLHVKKVYKFKKIPQNASLPLIYEVFQSPFDDLSTLYSPRIILSNCENYDTEKFLHDSGYDSYITGWIFLKICHLIAMKKVTNSIYVKPQSFKQHLNAVSPFVNKLNLSYSRIRYINLEGDDPVPSVSGFLYVSSRSSNRILNHAELCAMLEKYTFVEFQLVKQQRGAIVVTSNISCYNDILKDFENDADYVVQRYSSLKHSPYINPALWLTAFASGCLIAVLIAKYYVH
ncbi:poly(A)-specific ribonuclease PNLDC1 [Caerostris darwini]|uniref:Poly(A)-specific ribonuclease PNLDC1 n=1 Tax=Caerostris darwini TaxID=1538125 RepID=A0AAV4VCF3_9ARAC|nr:poly(A)-specific ribonuclease PNLDC1 [Caerostris darwini]